MVSWSHGSSHQTSSKVPSPGWDQFPIWVSPTPEKHLDHSVSLIFLSLSLSPKLSALPSTSYHLVASLPFPPPITSISAGVAVTSFLALCRCLWPGLPTSSNFSYCGLGIAFWFSNAVLIIFCSTLFSVLIEKNLKSFPLYWYTYYREDWIPQGYRHTST